jgi:hypothetical protein
MNESTNPAVPEQQSDLPTAETHPVMWGLTRVGADPNKVIEAYVFGTEEN